MVSSDELGTARWRKSTKSDSGGSGCVNIAVVGDLGLIHDSKNPEVEVLAFSKQELQKFIRAAKAGEHDL